MSGTEPLLRVYAEAASPELVSEILSTAEAFVRTARLKTLKADKTRKTLIALLAFRVSQFVVRAIR